MKICAICGKESGTVESFKMSTEARAMFAERYRDANLDEYLHVDLNVEASEPDLF